MQKTKYLIENIQPNKLYILFLDESNNIKDIKVLEDKWKEEIDKIDSFLWKSLNSNFFSTIESLITLSRIELQDFNFSKELIDFIFYCYNNKESKRIFTKIVKLKEDSAYLCMFNSKCIQIGEIDKVLKVQNEKILSFQI